MDAQSLNRCSKGPHLAWKKAAKNQLERTTHRGLQGFTCKFRRLNASRVVSVNGMEELLIVCIRQLAWSYKFLKLFKRQLVIVLADT